MKAKLIKAMPWQTQLLEMPIYPPVWKCKVSLGIFSVLSFYNFLVLCEQEDVSSYREVAAKNNKTEMCLCENNTRYNVDPYSQYSLHYNNIVDSNDLSPLKPLYLWSCLHPV